MCQEQTTSKFFTHRVTEAKNRLPNAVVTALTLNSFKHRLDTQRKHFQYAIVCVIPDRLSIISFSDVTRPILSPTVAEIGNTTYFFI